MASSRQQAKEHPRTEVESEPGEVHRPLSLEEKKQTLAVGAIPCAPHLWAIHGKYYDLSAFVPQHPGGEEMILLGKGRDCTEMFESIHCLSKRAVHKMLERYEVKTPEGAPPPPTDSFSWTEDGFYATVTKRVKDHFETTDPKHRNYKATSLYWAKISAMFGLWLFLIYNTYTSVSFVHTLLSAALAGFMMNMIGFNAMHDGSHYAISKKPWVNKTLHCLWNNWNLWSHFIWLRHHVYGHHAYTAVYRKDPDIVNIMPIVRKSPISRFFPNHKAQPWSAFVLLMFLPNQHIGQAFMYAKAGLESLLFSTVPLEKFPASTLLLSICIYIPSLFFHFVLPFLLLNAWTAYFVIVTYWTAQGIGYFINIAPNHDTLDTHYNLEDVAAQEKKDATKEGAATKRDWGVQQVIGSGNHTTDKGVFSLIVTQLWGGMNYQIEHHLFPSVSHMHYAAISSIVEKTCAEFNVPYVQHSWFTALKRFAELVSMLGKGAKKVKDE